MSQKSKLIDSMTNLIQHVSINSKNQQQIFATLSLSDVKKILSNLQDSNQKLRKTTLILLSELLHDNPSLQKRFCQLTSMPQFPGKIVLSQRFPKNILYDKKILSQVIKLLKDNHNYSTNNNKLEQKGLFWYIDGNTSPIILQIAKKNSINLDPINCIVGVWIQSEDKQSFRQTKNINTLTISNQMLNQNQQKVRLNKSFHFQPMPNNNTSQFKLKTPIKSTIPDSTKFQLTKHHEHNYIEPYPKPIQIRSQIKNPSKFYATRISITQSKSNQLQNPLFQTVKYIKPNHSSTIAQCNTIHHQFQPLSKTVQLFTPNGKNHKNNGEFKNYVTFSQDYKKN